MAKHIEDLFGVFFNIPKQISDKVAKIQKEFGISYSGNYMLTPHVTFYATKFTKNAVEKFEKEFKDLKLKPFKVKMGKVKSEVPLRKGNTFLYISILKNKPLMDVHKSVLEVANRLRGGLIRAKDLIRIKQNIYSSEEVEYIKKYGFMRVLKFFRPHITLGELSKKDAKERDLKNKLTKRLKSLEGRGFMIDSIKVDFQPYDYHKKMFVGKAIFKEIKLK